MNEMLKIVLSKINYNLAHTHTYNDKYNNVNLYLMF